jgi:hypothetical protein
MEKIQDNEVINKKPLILGAGIGILVIAGWYLSKLLKKK